LGTAYKLGTGIAQSIQAGRARRRYDQLQRERPEYERPGEVNQNLGLARVRASDPGFAGESAMRDRSELNAANTASLAASGGDPFAAAIAAQGQLEASARETSAMGEQIRMQDEQRLSQALLTSAQYSDMEFQMNEFAPWADAVQKAQLDFRDNRQGAIRNIGGALNQVSGASLGLLMQGGLGGTGESPFNADAIAGIVAKYGGGGGQQSGTAGTGFPDWAELLRLAQELQNRPQ